MKIQIRYNIFETNSSSSHSLTIAEYKEGQLLDTLYPDYGTTDTLTVGSDEFGWDWATFDDAATKLSYCAIYVRDWVEGDDQPKFFDILTKVIQEHTGIKNIIYPYEKGDYTDYTGYIDHQSVEDRDLDYLFENPELLRQFIFNPESTLRTGNDNEYDPLKGDYDDDD